MATRAYIEQSKRVDWNTNGADVSMFRRALGGEITTDPCSNENSVVGARFAYDIFMNGLVWPWFGSFYVNPPFGPIVPQFFQQGLSELALGRAHHGIYLLPARVDTRWFHAYALQATEIMMCKGRRRFLGATNSAPFPTMFIYYGPHKELFRQETGSEGAFWTPTPQQRLNARRYARTLAA